MPDFRRKLDEALQIIKEYSGTPEEVRKYRASKKGKKALKGQNKRARERRKKDGGGKDEEHNAHERKRYHREKEGKSANSGKCAKCGKTGGRMEEHHPHGYGSEKTEKLCSGCHQKTKINKIKSGMKKAKDA